MLDEFKEVLMATETAANKNGKNKPETFPQPRISKPSAGYPHKDSDHYTEYDHSCKWKIKAEVLPLNADIARQPAYPVQFVMEEVNDQPGQRDQYSHCDYDFP